MLIASPKLTPVRRPGSTLTRVDFVLIAASLLVLAVNAAIYLGPIGTKNGAAPISVNLPDRTSHSSGGQALLKARIGFARRIVT
jgi:hypothetical protein